MASIGHDEFTLQRAVMVLLWPFTRINQEFGTSFCWFYLFIPFLNRFISSLTKREMYTCVSLCLTIFVVPGSLPCVDVGFNRIMWYCILYLVGACVRRYPMRWMNSLSLCSYLLVASILSVVGWVVLYDLDAYAVHIGLGSYDYFVSEAYRLFAFLTSLLLFCLFKNIKLPYVRSINVVASTTFGVLLIHDASGMRTYLWEEVWQVCKCCSLMPTLPFVGFSLTAIVVTFVVCAAVEYFRKKIFWTVLKNSTPLT